MWGQKSWGIPGVNKPKQVFLTSTRRIWYEVFLHSIGPQSPFLEEQLQELVPCGMCLGPDIQTIVLDRWRRYCVTSGLQYLHLCHEGGGFLDSFYRLFQYWKCYSTTHPLGQEHYFSSLVMGLYKFPVLWWVCTNQWFAIREREMYPPRGFWQCLKTFFNCHSWRSGSTGT